ncbi:MAG: diguanylate cyclase domain-containing protein [Aestuariibacter sp.]
MKWKRLLFYKQNDQDYFEVLAAEQADMFFQQSISNTRALMLGAVLFAATFILYRVEPTLLLSWLALQLGLGVVLTVIARRFRTATEDKQALLRFMCIRMVMGNVIAAVFGASLFLLPAETVATATPIFLLMLLMICIITIFRYAAIPSYFISINVSIALPVITYLLLHLSLQNSVYIIVMAGGINVIIYAGLRMAQTSKDVIILNARLREEILEHIATKDELESLALQDYLTGLGNRRLFEKMLVAAIARAKREMRPVLVLYIDLDYFKPINDEYGHEIGDKLLQAVAQRIKGNVRISDTVARIGGDEFIVVMESIDDRDNFSRIVDKFDQELRKPYMVDSLSLKASASVGMAIYPEDGQSWEELMRVADNKMYLAKEMHHNAES